VICAALPQGKRMVAATHLGRPDIADSLAEIDHELESGILQAEDERRALAREVCALYLRP